MHRKYAFDVVQLARLANIDPELCLQARNQDFIQSVQSETKDTKNRKTVGSVKNRSNNSPKDVTTRCR